MVSRISSLEGNYNKGSFGYKEKNLQISEVNNLLLYQVSVWPNTLNEIGEEIAKFLSIKKYPDPNMANTNSKIAMLRVEPLKWWVFGNKPINIPSEKGSILDLSHSRTHIRISGKNSISLLKRFISIDLRESNFIINSVASTNFHHVGITLWRSVNGYEIFIPRAFALSLFEIILEGALQFGYEIK